MIVGILGLTPKAGFIFCTLCHCKNSKQKPGSGAAEAKGRFVLVRIAVSATLRRKYLLP